LFTSAQTCEVPWVGALPYTSTSLNPGFSAGWYNSFLVHLNLKCQGSCVTTLLLHNCISMPKVQEIPSRVRPRLGDRVNHRPPATCTPGEMHSAGA